MRAFTNADLVVLGVPEEEPGLRIVAADGSGADRLVGTTVAFEGTVLGHVYKSGQAALVADAREDERADRATTTALGLGPAFLTPLVAGGHIHVVGVIIMLAGVVALAILLVRSVSGLRRPDTPGQPPVVPGPSLQAGYRQDSAGRDVPPAAATRISTQVYTAPDPRADQQRVYPQSHRRPRTP